MLFIIKTDIKNATNGAGVRYYGSDGDAASVYGNFIVHQVKSGAYYDVCIHFER